MSNPGVDNMKVPLKNPHKLQEKIYNPGASSNDRSDSINILCLTEDDNRRAEYICGCDKGIHCRVSFLDVCPLNKGEVEASSDQVNDDEDEEYWPDQSHYYGWWETIFDDGYDLEYHYGSD